MRATWAIVIATLTLGLVSRPTHGQILQNGASVLEKIHMVDAQSGWAIFNDYRLPAIAVLVTTDGGTHWRDVTPPNSSGQRVAALDVAALSSPVAWVTRIITNSTTLNYTSEILRTADGGRTWKSAAIPAPSVTWITFINPREGWLIAFLVAALGANEFADIYRSTDGGETWSKAAMSSGLPYGVKRSITFLNSAAGWITVLDPTGNQPYPMSHVMAGALGGHRACPCLANLCPDGRRGRSRRNSCRPGMAQSPYVTTFEASPGSELGV